MRRLCLLVALTHACRPSAADPPAPTEMPTLTADAIDSDLAVLLTSAAPAAIEARAVAHADAYAQRLTATHADRARTDKAVLGLAIAALLARLYPHAPARVSMSAGLFLDAFFYLQTTDLDDLQRHALRDQSNLVRVLAGGIDRPLPDLADPVRPDRVCVVATPHGPGLMPIVDCTCGEQLACRATRRGDALELAVHRLPGAYGCDDCVAAWTTCTVPPLTPGETVRITQGDRLLGSLLVDAAGRLPVGACLPP